MRKIIIFITFLCALIMLTGCSALEKLGLGKSNDELTPASSIVMGEDEAKKLTDKVPIHLYFAGEDNSKLKLEVRYIPMADAKKSVDNLASIIVKELIKGPLKDCGLKATIPAGTQLRTPVKISSGVATVDLSKEIIDKHPGGKDAEQLTIFSIVNSLTELKDVQKVKFLVNGKPVKNFKDHFQFDIPFPRSTSIISKSPSGGTASPAPSDAGEPLKPSEKVQPDDDKDKKEQNDKKEQTGQKGKKEQTSVDKNVTSTSTGEVDDEILD